MTVTAHVRAPESLGAQTAVEFPRPPLLEAYDLRESAALVAEYRAATIAQEKAKAAVAIR